MKKKKDNLSIYRNSFNNFSFIKKINPDFVILNNFIEHIEDLNDFDNLLKAIKKNAYIIILTPDNLSYSRKFFGLFWSGYHSPRHVNIFNKKSLQFFLEKKKIQYTIKNIFDPLSAISSFKNCVSDLVDDFSFKKLFKLTFYFFYCLIDIFFKNRILIFCKKKID